ncbi:hypothetical protein KORDIASMS9_03031 [Kordia sp. SMS9]|uniref:hypothetical protein n=1 Tax=Kordia sp. SMS9 TaxID=2282170 RepID=UPI000E0D2746|nr:hypothetical protein [Kordia sp. SMS9]AXG70785.1 hypothetical protein KORDIASMS9_03031 [Kordia sp. SMS9]
MKKQHLKSLVLNKKSIVNLTLTSKIIGMGNMETAPGCVQNSHDPLQCSDTVQSFCNDNVKGSCEGCPVGTGTVETNCCD